MGQYRIEADLHSRKERIRALNEDRPPGLFICGLYQLFGREFIPLEGKPIRGIGVFPAFTKAGKSRLVGNITIDAPPFGPVTGFENHSGRTYLEGASPLGKVIRGKGNNGRDRKEGIRYRNSIGTYLHGPILPKNPAVADFLILTALKRRDTSVTSLIPLDDRVEEAARKSAASRPV